VVLARDAKPHEHRRFPVAKKQTVNPFAPFRAPKGSIAQSRFPFQLSWGDQPLAELQQRVDEATRKQTGYTYAHRWVAWELLRRTPFFETLATPAEVAEGLRPEHLFRWMAVSDVSAWVRKDPARRRGRTRVFEPFYRRTKRFPPPTTENDAPPGPRGEDADAELKLVFDRLIPPPLLISDYVRDGGRHVPSSDFVQVFLHRDAADRDIKRALNVLRKGYGPWANSRRRRAWIARPYTIWGKTYSAAEAIEILDGLAEGRAPVELFHSIVQRPTHPDFSDFLPPDLGEIHRSDSISTKEGRRQAQDRTEFALQRAKSAGLRLSKRLLGALRHNPLTTLVGRSAVVGTPE
jgi:hypothetical protein